MFSGFTISVSYASSEEMIVSRQEALRKSLSHHAIFDSSTFWYERVNYNNKKISFSYVTTTEYIKLDTLNQIISFCSMVAPPGRILEN